MNFEMTRERLTSQSVSEAKWVDDLSKECFASLCDRHRNYRIESDATIADAIIRKSGLKHDEQIRADLHEMIARCRGAAVECPVDVAGLLLHPSPKELSTATGMRVNTWLVDNYHSHFEVVSHVLDYVMRHSSSQHTIPTRDTLRCIAWFMCSRMQFRLPSGFSVRGQQTEAECMNRIKSNLALILCEAFVNDQIRLKSAGRETRRGRHDAVETVMSLESDVGIEGWDIYAVKPRIKHIASLSGISARTGAFWHYYPDGSCHIAREDDQIAGAVGWYVQYQEPSGQRGICAIAWVLENGLYQPPERLPGILSGATILSIHGNADHHRHRRKTFGTAISYTWLLLLHERELLNMLHSMDCSITTSPNPKKIMVTEHKDAIDCDLTGSVAAARISEIITASNDPTYRNNWDIIRDITAAFDRSNGIPLEDDERFWSPGGTLNICERLLKDFEWEEIRRLLPVYVCDALPSALQPGDEGCLTAKHVSIVNRLLAFVVYYRVYRGAFRVIESRTKTTVKHMSITYPEIVCGDVERVEDFCRIGEAYWLGLTPQPGIDPFEWKKVTPTPVSYPPLLKAKCANHPITVHLVSDPVNVHAGFLTSIRQSIEAGTHSSPVAPPVIVSYKEALSGKPYISIQRATPDSLFTSSLNCGDHTRALLESGMLHRLMSYVIEDMISRLSTACQNRSNRRIMLTIRGESQGTRDEGTSIMADALYAALELIVPSTAQVIDQALSTHPNLKFLLMRDYKGTISDGAVGSHTEKFVRWVERKVSSELPVIHILASQYLTSQDTFTGGTRVSDLAV